jgi:hypothetical protein
MISSATSSIPLEVTGFVPLEVTGFVPPTMTGFVPPKMTGQGNCKARIGLKIKVELILASLGARPCAPTNPDFFVGAQGTAPAPAAHLEPRFLEPATLKLPQLPEPICEPCSSPKSLGYSKSSGTGAIPSRTMYLPSPDRFRYFRTTSINSRCKAFASANPNSSRFVSARIAGASKAL